MDLGATKHMTSHQIPFYTYKIIFKWNVYLDDDSIMEAIGMDYIIMEVVVKEVSKRVWIMEVFHIAKLQANLLSMSKLMLMSRTYI